MVGPDYLKSTTMPNHSPTEPAPAQTTDELVGLKIDGVEWITGQATITARLGETSALVRELFMELSAALAVIIKTNEIALSSRFSGPEASGAPMDYTGFSPLAAMRSGGKPFQLIIKGKNAVAATGDIEQAFKQFNDSTARILGRRSIEEVIAKNPGAYC